MPDRSLSSKVALVAGATRGAGRGIAVELGAAGATVYCTGRTTRSSRSPMNRPETIDDTADRVAGAGGTGIPVRVDHSVPEEVAGLIERIEREQGRLDILVNDIWGADSLADWQVPFWEHSLADGQQLLRQAVETHVITSWHAVPLLLRGAGGLIIEITDGDDDRYRGSFFYDLAKNQVIRLARAQAAELGPRGITAVALTPGFLRSEAMLERFGVSEDNWRDGAARDPHFIASETPHFIGRAVVALAGDPDVSRRGGRSLSSWGLSHDYGFTDLDGSRPDWGRHFATHVQDG